MSTDTKHTQGKATVEKPPIEGMKIIATPSHYLKVVLPGLGKINLGTSSMDNYAEWENVANITAEAFNTTNECGLTPKQLLEQRNELLEALKRLYDSIDSCVELTPEKLIMAKTAINKATNK